MIFDPLDRKVTVDADSPDAEMSADQATKSAELVDLIQKMTRINCQEVDLKVPLANSQFDFLNSQFKALFDQCVQKGNEYIKNAEDQNSDLKSNFDHDPVVIRTLKTFKFFFEHRLLEDAKQRYSNLVIYIQNTNQAIQNIKNQLSIVQKMELQQKAQASQILVYTIPTIFLNRQDANNYSVLVQTICKVVDEIHKYKNN